MTGTSNGNKKAVCTTSISALIIFGIGMLVSASMTGGKVEQELSDHCEKIDKLEGKIERIYENFPKKLDERLRYIETTLAAIAAKEGIVVKKK